MMDFVRRLAPSREGDITRAVAVLPSRFSSESPLRATTGEARPAQRDTVTDVQPLQGALGSEQTRSETEEATPLARPLSHLHREAPDIGVDDARAFQDRHGANFERAKPVRPETLAAPRATLPLSQAILAQRSLQPKDDSQVVHVTIGRIDVVASTAPAPAVRRRPTPREPKVTLADYLRGSDGNRR
jgi:hypothetical protein